MTVPDPDPTAPFATVGDLPSQQDQATRQADALAQATDLIRAATGQVITRVTDDTVVLPGDGRMILQLPQIPVISVTSVNLTLGTNRLVPLNQGIDYLWHEDGRLESLYRNWLLGWDVVVVYTHGYDVVPGDLVRLTGQLADRILDGTLGARTVSEAIGQKNMSITYPTPRSSGVIDVFDDAQKAIIAKYTPAFLP